jgi:hypothetical protein
MTMPDPFESRSAWLLLAHQLPPKPAYFRVKIWRRLQDLGSVAIKASLYALPSNTETREDFQWLLREIQEGGGEATLFEARLVDGLTDQEVRALFDTARDADYDALAIEARNLAETVVADPEQWRVRIPELRSLLTKLRRRLGEVVEIDFFGANGRDAVEGLLSGIESRLTEAVETEKREETMPAEQEKPHGRTWVTRMGVHVDRIASAWLIRRFIDPEARFKFVADKGYVPEPGEIRFDMFEGEFTHHGDRCTFETLIERFSLDDPALRAIAEVVHDIDLRDGKFGREDTAGIERALAGIARSSVDDAERAQRSAELFNALHAAYASEVMGRGSSVGADAT